MLKDSEFLGTQRFDEPEDLKERLGYRDPPVGISLFTGAGGFDLGFANAGFDVRVMIENDEAAADTLRINDEYFDDHSDPVLFERDIQDVATWEILEAAGLGVGGATAIFGGPPCPGFSHANSDRSRDDPRNALYLEMVRIVHQAKPVFFVMENVPGMATMADGEVIQEACENFQAGGYHVRWDILDAADYGVPQHRERIFILGKRVDVAAMPEEGNPQFHIGAKPGRIHHPESFREKHDLDPPDQATLDAYASDPETIDELLENVIQDGVGAHADSAEEVASADD